MMDGVMVVGVNIVLWMCVFGVESSVVRLVVDEWY